MNNRTPIFIALLSTSICAASPVSANECDAALIRDNISQFTSVQEKLAILSIYDQQTHQSGSTSFSGEISLPIEGIPIGAGSDFSDTEDTKTSVFEYYRYNYSRDDALAYIRSRLSPESANAYVECLRLKQDGLFLWFTNVTDQAATLNIRWSPPTGTAATQSLETTPQFLGTSTPESIVDPTWAFNATRSYILDRLASSELRVVMNLGGHSGTAFIPKPPVFVVPTWTYAERIARGDRFRVAFDVGSCPDSACFVDFTQSPMGNLKFGESYSVFYIPGSKQWVTRGPNQGLPGCGLLEATYPLASNDPGSPSPNSGAMSLWGAHFGFNDLGEVIEKAASNFCRGPGKVVGHIHFEE